MPRSSVMRALLSCSVLLVALSLPASAAAKPPAKGKYDCQQYSAGLGIYIDNGWLKIVSRNRYRASGGNSGKYRYSAAQKKLSFLTGAYKKSKWHGFYEPKGTRGRQYDTITIRDNTGDDLLYCYRY